MIDAQVLLAEMMVHGKGGPKDHAEAFRLFEAAAQRDHAGAQFALGAMLGGGHDIAMDRVAAQLWFVRAAAQDHHHAQLMLGRYLARGLAGETDVERARQLFSRALAAGLPDAARELQALPPLEPDPAEDMPGQMAESADQTPP
jgi:hypothetical protein